MAPQLPAPAPVEEDLELDLMVVEEIDADRLPTACGTSDGCSPSCASSCTSAV